MKFINSGTVRGLEQPVGEPDNWKIQSHGISFCALKPFQFPFSPLAFLSFIPPQTPSIPNLRVSNRAVRHEQGKAKRDESATEASL